MASRIVSFSFALALAPAGVAHALDDGSAPRFQPRASAATRATPDAATAMGGRFALTASAVATPSVAAPAQTAGTRFRIDAVASATNLVCYNDTIFRDDFDANGL